MSDILLYDGHVRLALEWGPTIESDGCRVEITGEPFMVSELPRRAEVSFHLTEEGAGQLVAQLGEWLAYRAGLRTDTEMERDARRLAKAVAPSPTSPERT